MCRAAEGRGRPWAPHSPRAACMVRGWGWIRGMAPGPQPTACPSCAVPWHPWVRVLLGSALPSGDVSTPSPAPFPLRAAPRPAPVWGSPGRTLSPRAVRAVALAPPAGRQEVKGARAAGSCAGASEEAGAERGAGRTVGRSGRTGRATRGAQEEGEGRTGPPCPPRPRLSAGR